MKKPFVPLLLALLLAAALTVRVMAERVIIPLTDAPEAVQDALIDKADGGRIDRVTEVTEVSSTIYVALVIYDDNVRKEFVVDSEGNDVVKDPPEETPEPTPKETPKETPKPTPEPTPK